MKLEQLCRILEKGSVGTAIRESSLLFPLIEGIHVLALAFSVGLILISDLRLMGMVLRKRPVSEVWEQFFPWLATGFAIMFVSGFLLFWSHALAAYNSIAFRTKLLLLLLAGVNAAVYHLTIYKKMNLWDTAAVPPAGARAAGWISLIFWAGIIAMGRIMAYTF